MIPLWFSNMYPFSQVYLMKESFGKQLSSSRLALLVHWTLVFTKCSLFNVSLLGTIFIGHPLITDGGTTLVVLAFVSSEDKNV